MAQSYINDESTTYSILKSRLLGGAPSQQQSDHFDVLNRHLPSGLVTPGQLVIIPEADREFCSIDEAWLMRHAQDIRRHLETDVLVSKRVIDNYDLLQSALGYTSIGIGSATSAWAQHLKEVTQTLEDIERLHQRLKDGALDRKTFIRQREVLFKSLDLQLRGVARFGTGLKGNKSLKRVLGISTKSFLHKGEIAGYAQRIREIAQMSKWLGKGTYLGMALDVSATGMEIKEACVTGREAQCRRTKYVETGRLAGAVMGAAAGGKYGAIIVNRACSIFLGVFLKPQGALVCAVIGGAGGGYAGGDVFGDLGASTGGKLLEVDGDLIFQPEGA